MATVLFVTPHQDDETLSMGSSIQKHVESGHDVHVLLATDGSASGAKDILGMTKSQFVEARDDEFFRATRMLGIPFDNQHIGCSSVGVGTDGALDYADVKEMIQDFLIYHPDAWVKTYSDLPATGRHVDHIACGKAARELYNDGEVTNLRLYVEPWLVTQFQSAHPSVALSSDAAMHASWVMKALDEYDLSYPTGEKFGIGHISVPSQITYVRAHPASRYHVP